MKARLLFSVMLFCTAISFAQSPNTFLIKGNIKNFDHSFFEVYVGGFFNSTTIAIKVDKKGNFSKACAVDGVQDVYLQIGDDNKRFFAAAGDTLIMNWNSGHFGQSFTLSSPNKGRVQELSTLLKLSDAFDNQLQTLQPKLYDKSLADSTKFNMINDAYNAELQFLKKNPITAYSFKIFGDVYFKYASMLWSTRLLRQYWLFDKQKSANDNNPIAFVDHTLLSEQLFKQSEAYRDFIFNQVRFYSPFNSYMSESGVVPSNFTEKDYLAGRTFLPIVSIKDWFITKAIINGFGNYDFMQTKAVYDDFLLTSQTPAYTDTLRNFYVNMEKLAPGKPAPQFTLKDEFGNAVSLKDLQGKVVFIDFWGVYCGPCIGDIKGNGAKFHEKYKDKEVVFVNICVDVAEKEWKKSIKELNLTGKNLLAQGWTDNQVCKDYAIRGIPHYVLIDHSGNIINNNAPGMWELVGDAENVLDKAIANVKK